MGSINILSECIHVVTSLSACMCLCYRDCFGGSLYFIILPCCLLQLCLDLENNKPVLHQESIYKPLGYLIKYEYLLPTEMKKNLHKRVTEDKTSRCFNINHLFGTASIASHNNRLDQSGYTKRLARPFQIMTSLIY